MNKFTLEYGASMLNIFFGNASLEALQKIEFPSDPLPNDILIFAQLPQSEN